MMIKFCLILLSFTMSTAYSETSYTLAPRFVKEIPAAEREYQDCTKNSAGSFQCPSGAPANYKCYDSRSGDILSLDSDDDALKNIRIYILGHTDTGEDEAQPGRKAGERCSGRKSFSLTPFGDKIELLDDNSNSMGVIAGETPLIRTQHALNLGCESNICVTDANQSVPSIDPYANRKCAPRKICRCLEEGEKTSDESLCCEGLVRDDDGYCISPIVPFNGSEELPLHVSNENGGFTVNERVVGYIQRYTITLKALDWLLGDQQDSPHCLSDDRAVKKIGQNINKALKTATAKYNKDYQALSKNRNDFKTYSEQIGDPLAYFQRAGSIVYRGKKMNETDFQHFVHNAVSGAEIFNLMADEQRMQLYYEDHLRKAIDGIIVDFKMMEDGFRSISAKTKGTENLFNESFSCRRKRRFLFITWKPKMKNRWRSRYSTSGPFLDALFRKELVTSKFFLESTNLGSNISKKLKKSFKNYLLEPYMPEGVDYYDHGKKENALIALFRFSSEPRNPRYLTSIGHVRNLMIALRKDFKSYYKEHYIQGASGEVIDASLGFFSNCSQYLDNIHQAPKECERFKNGVQLMTDAGIASFLKLSAGSKKYRDSVLNRKADVYLELQQELTDLQKIYYSLSAIPSGYEKYLTDNSMNLDYKKAFDQLNKKVPGYLRFKSYLFLKARAKELSPSGSGGLSPGGQTDTPDLAGIYGSGVGVNSEGEVGTTQNDTLKNNNLSLQTSDIGSASTSGVIGDNGKKIKSNISISSGSASSNPYQRSLASLNKRAEDFAKKNPKLKAKLSSLFEKQKANQDALLNTISNKMSGNDNQSALTSLGSTAAPSLSQSNKEKKEESTVNLDETSGSGSQSLGNNQSGYAYRESGGSSSADKNQLTTLSDYELSQAIDNIKNQPNLFRGDEEDTLFNKISKTYARSYKYFLVKKKLDPTPLKKQEATPDINNLLEEF